MTDYGSNSKGKHLLWALTWLLLVLVATHAPLHGWTPLTDVRELHESPAGFSSDHCALCNSPSMEAELAPAAPIPVVSAAEVRADAAPGPSDSTGRTTAPRAPPAR